jgi:hypothetical protein
MGNAKIQAWYEGGMKNKNWISDANEFPQFKIFL